MIHRKPTHGGNSGFPAWKFGAKLFLSLMAIATSVLITGCESSGYVSTTSPPTVSTFTIGGSVSGLSGSGLVLQDNGGDNLAASSNGAFAFKTALARGSAYKVTVLTQPSSPAQTCRVTNANGIANSNVTNVQVTCPAPMFTIGGTVKNLVGSGGGLVLQDNAGDSLLVKANGTFTFATPIASSGSYDVTVLTQPSSPTQTCGVTHSNGAANANVTNVLVDCGHGEWSWMSGSNAGGQKGTYGTQGMTSASNVPGARDTALGWTDSSGNFWLFGGFGLDSVGTAGGGSLNDLWKYDINSGEWTWMTGSNLANQNGTYGTQATTAPGNVPGARSGAVSWTDQTGNLWLFSGLGQDSVGTAGGGFLNDLWKYDINSSEWTWMGGSNLANQNGNYGTRGTASLSSVPGARYTAVGWTDSSGNLWLFGGLGLDSVGTAGGGDLNDLWKYNISSGEWTWMSGSNLANQNGTYGTQGTTALGNVLGARGYAVSWTDSSGNLWLFGGFGPDSVGTAGFLNDLWKYNISSGEWTWMSGSNLANQNGSYGIQGTAAPANVPSARDAGASWSDSFGNLWLFGGFSVPLPTNNTPDRNDLWKYNITSGEWTWVNGSNLPNQIGAYGTQRAIAPGNVPGARDVVVTWVDSSGNLWLFGGFSLDVAGGSDLNDLWVYTP
jgi:hypothetical protein